MLIAARGVAAAFWVFFTVMLHVERSLRLHAAMIHGIAPIRCAERRELAVQRGDHQLHRLRVCFGCDLREAAAYFLGGEVLDAIAGELAPIVQPDAAEAAAAIVDQNGFGLGHA